MGQAARSAADALTGFRGHNGFAGLAALAALVLGAPALGQQSPPANRPATLPAGVPALAPAAAPGVTPVLGPVTGPVPGARPSDAGRATADEAARRARAAPPPAPRAGAPLPATMPAASSAALRSTRTLEDQYFSAPSPSLTPRERKGLAIAEKWSGASSAATDLPAPGPDGLIRYTYGAVQASLVCAVLQVCDVELQPGEVVQSLHVGDAARWQIAPAVTGEPPLQTQHLVIKPTDVGLDTSLVVTTNRRTYHLRLKSHRTQTMVRIGWVYPDEAAAQWEALRRRQATDRQTRTLPATNEYLGDLSFNYRVTGEAPWKPVRVYNDGTKTIIQLPASVRANEAPALMVLRREGNLFSDDETAIVNYRLQNDRYVVDAVFERAILVAGVGSSQTRITIEKEP